MASDSADSLEKGLSKLWTALNGPHAVKSSLSSPAQCGGFQKPPRLIGIILTTGAWNTNAFLNTQGQRYFLFCELLVLSILPAGLWELFPHLNINSL